jgi:hypothetical protein
MWPQDYEDDAYSSGADAVPTATFLGRFLVGTFDILQVTSEGVPEPTVLQWRLWITTTHANAVSRCSPASCPDTIISFPFVGLRQPSTQPRDTLRLKQRLFTGTIDEAEFVVDHARGLLSWQTMPGWLDAGAIFRVEAITPFGFRGRWQDGGIAMTVIDRDGATVVEALGGYYCAFRTGA